MVSWAIVSTDWAAHEEGSSGAQYEHDHSNAQQIRHVSGRKKTNPLCEERKVGGTFVW